MLREYGRRLALLIAGQILSAIGVVMILHANIGLEPWSVLHQGMAFFFGFTYGTAAILTGVLVIFIAFLMGESFGVGTLANIFLCPIMIDIITARGWIPEMRTMPAGILFLLLGMEILTLGTLLYMKSALGAGPRDALMVALSKKSGKSVGLCRAIVELTAVLIGWRLGGPVGVGTIIGAFGIGILFNANFTLFHFEASKFHQENIPETIQRLRSLF